MIGLRAQAGLLFVEADSEFTFSGDPIYGGYYFYRVICVALLINADDLQAKTAEIEE